jgi:hypothetical protein
MAHEDEMDDILIQGNEAERLLRDDYFNKVVVGLKHQYYHAWLGSESVDERERIYASANAIDDLVGQLQTRVTMAHQVRMAQQAALEGNDNDDY